MVELARCPDGATGRSIAENQYLPVAYLEQILARLRNASWFPPFAGRGKVHPGKGLETITLAQILEAVEGPITIAECDDVPYCQTNSTVCVLRKVYVGANKVLYDYLNGITLAKLAKQQEEQELPAKSDYAI